MTAPMAVAAVSDGRPWVFGVEAVPTEMTDDQYRYWLVRIGRAGRRGGVSVSPRPALAFALAALIAVAVVLVVGVHGLLAWACRRRA